MALRNGKYIIDLGMVNIMHLGKPLPCSSSSDLPEDLYVEFIKEYLVYQETY
jgi:hypothetical protein